MKCKSGSACNSTSHGSRAAMVHAFAKYHFAGLQLRLHNRQWAEQASANIATLERYYAAIGAAPGGVLANDALRAEGEATEARCNAAHARRERLMAMRNAHLKEALKSMGAHHGAAMARDTAGSASQRYWRHARAMARTLRSHMPHSRIVGLEHDFPSASGWAAALGFRGTKELIAHLQSIGVREPCRLAGVL